MIRDFDLKDTDWLQIKERLPIGDSPEEQQERKKLWLDFDPNQNGFVSLAEADLALLRLGGPLRVVHLAKKAVIQAFNMSKSLNNSKDILGDDYIEQSEFVSFLKNLRLIFSQYYLFKRLDLNFDNRLDYQEFINGEKIMKSWGQFTDPAKQVFLEFDKSNGGFLLFDQFIKICEKYQLNIENDQDIIKNMKGPRRIYLKQSFLKKGYKRPPFNPYNNNITKSMFEKQEVVNDDMVKPQIFRKIKDQHKIKNYFIGQFRYYSPKVENIQSYDQLEINIQNIQQENNKLKEELQNLKEELYQYKKQNNQRVIKI